MITKEKKFVFPTTGKTGVYSRAHEDAGKILINALLKKGRKFITLGELYDTLGAEVEREQNGIRYAVEAAKKRGLITSTLEISVYAVVR